MGVLPNVVQVEHAFLKDEYSWNPVLIPLIKLDVRTRARGMSGQRKGNLIN